MFENPGFFEFSLTPWYDQAFKTLVILAGTYCYLIVVLIYISLITNDVEYLFFWMFCESVSTLVNYGFNYFVHFYFVLLLCFDSLYIV